MAQTTPPPSTPARASTRPPPRLLDGPYDIAPLDERGLPLVIAARAQRALPPLIAWLEAHQEELAARLRVHGALLLRGFDVQEPHDFERVARAVDPELSREYMGTSPRKALTDYVFSASELPGYYPIPQHCEMSFTARPPRRLFFCCLTAPASGGETPLCDFRKVYAGLRPEVRDRFAERGIRIVRNYGAPDGSSARGANGAGDAGGEEGAGGAGDALARVKAFGRKFDPWQLKRWDEIFGTTDRAEVEAKCAVEGFKPTWLPDGGLRLTSEQEAARAHPETGDMAWFNHVQVFHLSTATSEYRRLFARRPEPWLFGMLQASRVLTAAQRRLRRSDELTLHCTYRDGREIPEADLEHVRDVIWQNLVVFPWRRGDVVAIDNAIVAHGRMPYQGPREVVVAWA
ncbi:TauD/TfdA family dioxygenase [Chondromyces apiculatus]|uniref:TauD/TfdA-like domain-containing protein n=1 Tax=Chondromyces apiculatus DSM 436 TaxID=1192034 RepID=A0A017T145_9BACT|nr:TauD/TfdA family dioxygenase [Chondromyces apiculatus]EYF02948.1 Hypothetical protein CAP_6371 [Chondromyces apiculatus DSM 436]